MRALILAVGGFMVAQGVRWMFDDAVIGLALLGVGALLAWEGIKEQGEPNA